jgi:hypothetical protein
MSYIVNNEEISQEEYASMAQQLVEENLYAVDSCKSLCND